MGIIPLQEMVDRVPELYEALRQRDSLANYVCELMRDGKPYRDTHRKWRQKCKEIRALVARACEIKP